MEARGEEDLMTDDLIRFTGIEDLAYFAGIVDGDGCISITKDMQRVARGGHPTYGLSLSVSNTNKDVLYDLSREFGGSVRLNARPTPVHQTIHLWTLFSDRAAEAIRALRPYLRIKAEQAWLALEFMASCPRYIGRTGLTAEDDALREGFYLALRAAKRT